MVFVLHDIKHTNSHSLLSRLFIIFLKVEICLCSKIESFIVQQAVKRNAQGRTCVYACIARARGSPDVISIHIFLTETQSYHMPKCGENGELYAREEGVMGLWSSSLCPWWAGRPGWPVGGQRSRRSGQG